MSGAEVVAAGWSWRHAGRRSWAVRDLDLTIGAGERVLLLGASGAGKSTLLAGLSGLLDTQDSGETVGSLRIDGLPAHGARQRSGLLLQDPDSQLVMTRSGDDVAFGPENHGVPREKIWRRVDDAMASVGFGYGRDRATAALSGGEKQRLALAGLLANRPGLLLLDEPTANLDPAGARLIRDAVGAAVDDTGATLIVVEHRVEQWLPIIDRVIVLAAGGGLLADGTPATVFDRYAVQLSHAGVWVPGSASVGRSVSPPTSAAAVLTATDVSYRYRGASRDAVAPASLQLAAGEIAAIVGPNGSGKSTLAMILAGLSRPSTGLVVAADSTRPLRTRSSASLVRAIGTVFQQPEHQFVRRTVRAELLQGPQRLHWPAAKAAARADDLLDRLGLAALAEANPFTLSGGQQRRLSVASALSAAPLALVLDEPTFGQDARTWRELLELLRAVRDGGTAMTVVSHDADFVDALADRVLTMNDGILASPQGAAVQA
ncbi:MAG: ABC transporter ATP-binding protein [Jatrophihabitans sp.]